MVRRQRRPLKLVEESRDAVADLGVCSCGSGGGLYCAILSNNTLGRLRRHFLFLADTWLSSRTTRSPPPVLRAPSAPRMRRHRGGSRMEFYQRVDTDSAPLVYIRKTKHTQFFKGNNLANGKITGTRKASIFISVN